MQVPLPFVMVRRPWALLFWRVACAGEVSWHWRKAREKAVASRAVLRLSDSCLIEVTECPKLHVANHMEGRLVTMVAPQEYLNENGIF